MSHGNVENLEIQTEFRTDADHRELPAQELRVNNYLKSREEIVAEFRFIASSTKEESVNKETSFATYGRVVKIAESYSYLHSLDEALSAPLEENY